MQQKVPMMKFLVDKNEEDRKMVRANFSAYGAYVTDSLHQWDVNRTLQVTGLNLSVVPEVHFSNSNMRAAIVRQATLEGGVVRAEIPNSLLQQPLRIKAHIGIYEGRTFKVVEKAEIPVIPRKRPEDYEIEDSDEEVYSFKRLENEIANMVTQAQFANVVAGVSPIDESGNNPEVVDLRYGADGVVYASAGEAVRSQTRVLNKKVNAALNELAVDEVIDCTLEAGYVSTNGELVAAGVTTKEMTTEFIAVKANDFITIHVPGMVADKAKWNAVSYYDENKNFIQRGDSIEELLRIIPSVDGYIRVSFRSYGYPCIMIVRKNLATVGASIVAEYHKSTLDYVPLNVAPGYVSSVGVFSAPELDTREIRTDYISVLPGEKYSIVSRVKNIKGPDNTGLRHWVGINTFDANKSHKVRMATIEVTEESANQIYTAATEITVPSDVYFIVVSSRSYDGCTLNVAKVNEAASEAVNTCHAVKGIAHRGFSIGAPENTLPAYRLAKQKGFQYAECDVSFTSDGVAVLLHDDTIDRTSDGTGSISTKTYSEVKALDFGSWFSSAYAGEMIPTFEEFIALCRAIGLRPYVELKAGAEEQIKRMVDTVIRYGMREKTTWVAFTEEHLSYVKAKDDHARLGIVVNEVTADTIATVQSLQTEHNDVFIDCAYITAAAGAELCAAALIPMEVWTVNDESTIKTLDPYISGVTSDNLVAGRVLYEANI